MKLKGSTRLLCSSTGKVIFWEQRSAQRCAQFWTKLGSPQGVYRCNKCHFFHLTKSKKL